MKPVHRINGVASGQDLHSLTMTPANAPDVARPSSNHGDHVYITLADGSVRALSSSVDYRVYQRLMCPDDSAFADLLTTVNRAQANDESNDTE